MSIFLTDAELWSATSALYEQGLCNRPGVDPDRWSPAKCVHRENLPPAEADALCKGCPVRGTCTFVGLTVRPNASTVMGGMWGHQLDELRAAIEAADELLTGFNAATRDQVDVIYRQRRASGWSGQAAFLSALADVTAQNQGEQDDCRQVEGQPHTHLNDVLDGDDADQATNPTSTTTRPRLVA